MASADGNTPPSTSAMDTAPARCSKGCGFFGNANTGGMCSKCYKETLAKSAGQAPSAAVGASPVQPAASVTAPPVIPTPVAEPPAAVAQFASASPPAPSTPAPVPAEKLESPPMSAGVHVTSEEPVDEEPPKKKQINTNRCWTCNKKIGLLGFQCKCEYYFCAEHRYSDKHECSFDFKALGKQQLVKANPTIAPSKLESM